MIQGTAQMGGFEMMGGWGGMYFGPLIMIAVLALVIYLIVALIRGIGGAGERGVFVEKTPLDILKERYARGEIDEREYEDRRKILSR